MLTELLAQICETLHSKHALRGGEDAMKSRCFVTLPGMLLFLAAGALAADYEITPLAGYTVGGQFESTDRSTTYELSDTPSFGLILGLRDRSRHDGAFYELLYSRQETDFQLDDPVLPADSRFHVVISTVHLGGRYGSTGQTLNPFVAGGIGATHFHPARGDDEIRASFSLGGGILVPLGDHLSFRFEARGCGTLFNSRGELFCTDGRCRVRIDGNLFWQFSAFSGMTLTF